jgi:hypothetical protein
MKFLLAVVSCVVFYLSGTFSGGQTATKADIKAVASAGHVKAAEYENDYFGVTVRLPEPNEHLVLNGLVAETRAILLEAVNEKGDMQHWHNFAIVAHSADIPGLTSTAQFVRSVRHQLERDGFQTMRAEIPVTIAGHEFIQSDLKMESKNRNYCKAVMFTQIKGYMFGFWMEAVNKEQLGKATNLDGRIVFR